MRCRSARQALGALRRGGLAVALATLPLGATLASADEILVIVHPQRSDSIDRETVAQIYLRRRQFWSDGSRILPINRESRSPSRRRFDRAVFGAFAGRLPDYWHRAYFRGVLPPPTLASDEAVRRFVAGEPRAVGYVAAPPGGDSVSVVLRIPAPADSGSR